jgi:hypothetical protein
MNRLKEISNIDFDAKFDGNSNASTLSPGKSSVMLLGFIFRAGNAFNYKVFKYKNN